MQACESQMAALEAAVNRAAADGDDDAEWSHRAPATGDEAALPAQPLSWPQWYAYSPASAVPLSLNSPPAHCAFASRHRFAWRQAADGAVQGRCESS